MKKESKISWRGLNKTALPDLLMSTEIDHIDMLTPFVFVVLEIHFVYHETCLLRLALFQRFDCNVK